MSRISRKPAKQMSKLINQEWYQYFLEQAKATVITLTQVANEAKLQTGWELGKMLAENHENFKRSEIYGEKVISTVATDLKKLNIKGWGERNLNYAVQFYKKLPAQDFAEACEMFKEPFSNWNKLKEKYLAEPKEKCDHHQAQEMVIKIWKCPKEKGGCDREWARSPFKESNDNN